MNILIVTSCIPYPLDSGGNISQYATLERLQKYVKITLCLFIYREEDDQNATTLQSKFPNIVIKKIDLRQSQSDHLSSHSFKAQIKSLIFKIKSLISSSKIHHTQNLGYDEFYDLYRISPTYIKNEKIIISLLEILNSEVYDLVQVEFYELLELVHIFPKKLKKIFISHESRFLRLKTAYTESKASIPYKEYILSINKAIELDFLKLYDAVITFSDQDKDILQDNGINNVYAVPFAILDKEFKINTKFSKAKQLVFVGGEAHAPNREGVDWFIKECLSKVYQRYGMPLIIVGKWNAERYKHIPNVKFTGFIENLDEVLENSIMIVPIRIGNGIRAKILYGMAKKVPIISTSIGCEGINIKDKEGILIADDKDSFISCIEFAINNPKDINSIVDNAYQYVYTNYNQQYINNARLKIYKTILEKEAK